MKKNLFKILIMAGYITFFLSSNVFAQSRPTAVIGTNSAPTYNNSSYYKTISTNQQLDAIYDQIPTYDGGSIAVGSSNAGLGHMRDFWVIRFDENGEIIWQRSLANNYLNEAKRIIEVSMGQYLIAGETFLPGNNFRTIYFALVADDGNVLVEKVLTPPGSTVTITNIVATNNGFLVSGTINADLFQSDTFESFLLKLNNSLDVVWMKILSFSPIVDDEYFNVYDLLPLKNSSDFIVLALAQTVYSQNPHTAWLMRFKADGSLVWKKALADSGPPPISMLNLLSLIEDNNKIIAVGYTLESFNLYSQSEGIIMTFDLNGTILSQRRYALETHISNTNKGGLFFNDIIKMPNSNNYLISMDCEFKKFPMSGAHPGFMVMDKNSLDVIEAKYLTLKSVNHFMLNYMFYIPSKKGIYIDEKHYVRSFGQMDVANSFTSPIPNDTYITAIKLQDDDTLSCLSCSILQDAPIKVAEGFAPVLPVTNIFHTIVDNPTTTFLVSFNSAVPNASIINQNSCSEK